MEIEKKFLLKEDNQVYANKKFFKNLTLLKLQIFLSGKRIVQSYLPLSSLKKLKTKPNFKPDEIRLRKYGKKYFLTIKSKGHMKRNEFEKEISKKSYNELIVLENMSLKKIRSLKKINGFNVEIDYYKKISLMTCEVEVENRDELDKIPNLGKEISGNKKYKNKNLAKLLN